jgi:PTH1 family peptidyl-tRNA hydrolase
VKIVVGLGNPGDRYRWTRHNLGFRVVDCLAERQGRVFRKTEALGRVATTCEPGRDGGTVLAKPRTFMNRSGRAALALLGRYDAAPEDLVVVYDDADLELGRIRVRSAGSPGGHRGVRSLIDALRTDGFPRVRLGVRGEGRDDMELADYVLEAFDPDEIPVSERLVQTGADAVEALLADGIESAMNRFNGLSVAGSTAEGADTETS